METINKILVAAHAVTFMASRLNAIAAELTCEAKSESYNNQAMDLYAVAERHEAVLAQVYKGLNGIAQDLGNYVTNTDAVDPLDASLMEPIFNLVLNAPLEDPQTLPNPDELPY